MINAKTLIRQCLLAVALAGTALGAVAGPVNFHVDLNTSTLNGAGLISLNFSKVGLAGPVQASVSNFTGLFGGVAPTGAVHVGADGNFTIANGADVDNFADVEALFGDMFGFDVAFSGDFMDAAGIDGSSLRVSLLGNDYAILAGDEFGVAQFDVVPGVGIVANATFPSFATVSAVPEPSDMLLMTTGLGLVGFMVRRRKEPAAR